LERGRSYARASRTSMSLRNLRRLASLERTLMSALTVAAMGACSTQSTAGADGGNADAAVGESGADGPAVCAFPASCYEISSTLEPGCDLIDCPISFYPPDGCCVGSNMTAHLGRNTLCCGAGATLADSGMLPPPCTVPATCVGPAATSYCPGVPAAYVDFYDCPSGPPPPCCKRTTLTSPDPSRMAICCVPQSILAGGGAEDAPSADSRSE
jgi:hypothetical protein